MILKLLSSQPLSEMCDVYVASCCCVPLWTTLLISRCRRRTLKLSNMTWARRISTSRWNHTNLTSWSLLLVVLLNSRLNISKLNLWCRQWPSLHVKFTGLSAPCGLRGWKNRPTPFPGGMSYKATKPGSVCPVSLPRFSQCVCCAVN